MITLYCNKNHTPNELCPECASLLDYTRKRLDKCPFQEGKTTCAKCPGDSPSKELLRLHEVECVSDDGPHVGLMKL